MTNEKNTDNNNPKSDVALWSHTPAKNFVLPFSKTFKTPFTTLSTFFTQILYLYVVYVLKEYTQY